MAPNILSRHGTRYHIIKKKLSRGSWETMCGLYIENHFCYETTIKANCKKCLKRKEILNVN